MFYKRFFYLLSIVSLFILVVASCSKLGSESDAQDVPEAKAKKIDIDNGAGLALMDVGKSGQSSTKSMSGENVRLVVIGKDGSTRLAKFDIDIDFSSKKINKNELLSSVYLVPSDIKDISSNFLLLEEMSVQYDKLLDLSYDDRMAFDKATSTLIGSYLLRKSDGALFRSPFQGPFLKYSKDDVEAYTWETWTYNIMDMNNGRTVVLSGDQLHFQEEKEDGSIWGGQIPDICIVKDEVDKLNVVRLGGKVFNKSLMFTYMPTDNNIVAFADNIPNGVWSFDLKLNPVFTEMSKELSDIVTSRTYNSFSAREKKSCFVAKGRNAYLFDIPDGNHAVIYKLDYSENEIGCHKISQYEVSSNPETIFPGLDGVTYYGVSDDTIILMSNSIVITINTKDDSVVFKSYPQGFPNDWRLFFEKGVHYELESSLQNITKYDIQKNETSFIPVQWDNNDALVNATVRSEDVFFSVYGVSRTAKKLAYLIEKESGKVILLSEGEYTGPVISNYCKLN